MFPGFIEMDAQLVRELFDYDASTGELRWRAGRNAGAVAGAITNHGHRKVNLGKQYYVHRLVWLWVYGEWPVTDIDHINLDAADNRLANLRLATPSQNLANQRGWRKGLKGIWRNHKGWAAEIKKDGKKTYLGTYPTPELAHAAYYEAAKSMFGEFARRA
jgi:hypothetical protein